MTHSLAVRSLRNEGAVTVLGVFDARRQCVSHGDVLRALSDDDAFRAAFTRALSEGTPAAFFWETPAVTRTTLGRAFECALVPAPSLAATVADVSPFAEHVRGDDDVVVFANLSGDATLVVPAPRATPACYAHLALFLRSGPPAQVSAFWRAVADAALARVGIEPQWLSTAGLGVPWLHVRIDAQPKYYRHAPYRAAPTAK